MKKRILLVEDDPGIREGITDYITGKEGDSFEVTSAADGDEGLFQIESSEWDMVLLDVMLPGIDGFSLCRTLRKKSDAPIIFITARGREEDVLYGYDLGCDDYIVKPFSMATLLAKINVLIRRTEGSVGSERIRCGRISIEPRKYRVFVDEQEIILPPKEYEILFHLLKNREIVCSREQLLIKLWGYEHDGDERILDNHMKKLRQALGSARGQIKTVIKGGYKLVGS